jgi:hypothetical protein
MPTLKGSKTEENLKRAFAGEAEANRRYLYFAHKADIEGYNDAAAVFRSTAEGETGHAHGHLQFLEACGDPATGLPFGNTIANVGRDRRGWVGCWVRPRCSGPPGAPVARQALRRMAARPVPVGARSASERTSSNDRAQGRSLYVALALLFELLGDES